MSQFKCPHCQEHSNIFSPPDSPSGAHELAKKWNVNVLADLVIDPELCASSDSGVPIVLKQPDHVISAEFRKLARTLMGACNL